MRSKLFHVHFFKSISAYGHDFDVKQRVIEVWAPDEQTALRLAQDEFCRLDQVRHWSLHADRCEVARADGLRKLKRREGQGASAAGAGQSRR